MVDRKRTSNHLEKQQGLGSYPAAPPQIAVLRWYAHGICPSDHGRPGGQELSAMMLFVQWAAVPGEVSQDLLKAQLVLEFLLFLQSGSQYGPMWMITLEWDKSRFKYPFGQSLVRGPGIVSTGHCQAGDWRYSRRKSLVEDRWQDVAILGIPFSFAMMTESRLLIAKTDTIADMVQMWRSTFYHVWLLILCYCWNVKNQLILQ